MANARTNHTHINDPVPAQTPPSPTLVHITSSGNMKRITEEKDLQECMDKMLIAFPETFNYTMEVMKDPNTIVFMSNARDYFFIAKKVHLRVNFTFHVLDNSLRGSGLATCYLRQCVNMIKAEWPTSTIYCSCRINNFSGVLTLVKVGFKQYDITMSKRSILYYKFQL